VPALPPGVYYVSVAASQYHTAARRSDGTVAVWGRAPFATQPVPSLAPGTSYLDLDLGVDRAVAVVGPASTFVRFGNGCAGTRAAAPLVPLDTPRLGRDFAITVRELPVGVAFLALGTQTLASRYGPLPLDLAPLGMSGCVLYVPDEALCFLLGNGHEAVWTAAIPNDVHLVAAEFYAQAIVFDPLAGNPLGAVLSDAMRARIGGR